MINGSELNKLQNTKVGDTINYYVNGTPMSGVVTAMSGSFINVAKDNMVRTIRIDDTFFVKDIIMKNKSWNEMTMEEKGEALVNVRAYSPRFLSKTWEQLPQELKDALKGSGFRKDLPIKKPKIEEPVEGQVEKGGGYRTDLPREKPKKMIIDEPEISKPAKKAHDLSTTSDDDDSSDFQWHKGDSSDNLKTNQGTYDSKGKQIDNKPVSPTKVGRADKHVATKSHSCDEVEKSIEKMNKEFAKLKSGVEQGAYGNAGGRPFAGVSTQMDIDASEDYEGATHNDFKEQFKHEKQKPETTMEGHNKKKDSSVSTGTTGVFNATNSSGEKKEEEE